MSWAAGLASAVAGGGILGNSLMSWTNNKKAATEAFRRQKALYMMDYNLHTPSAQMKLLKEAQLNPNLVYGGGNPADVSARVPNVDAANAGSADLGLDDAVNTWLNAKGVEGTNQLKQAQTDTVNAEKNLTLIKSANELLKYNDLKNWGSPGSASAFSQMIGMIKRLASTSVVDQLAKGVDNMVSSSAKWLQEKAKGLNPKPKGKVDVIGLKERGSSLVDYVLGEGDKVPIEQRTIDPKKQVPKAEAKAKRNRRGVSSFGAHGRDM